MQGMRGDLLFTLVLSALIIGIGLLVLSQMGTPH
jgi:hypothetical protein